VPANDGALAGEAGAINCLGERSSCLAGSESSSHVTYPSVQIVQFCNVAGKDESNSAIHRLVYQIIQSLNREIAQ
jgi:hypothetical protein